VFYGFGNELNIKRLGKRSGEKSMILDYDIFAVKYIPEIKRLFVASNKMICYNYDGLELEKQAELDTDNVYISKVDYDPFSKTLYGFSFNCDIFGWTLNENSFKLETRIMNNFKSFYPMIVNPLTKSVIINKDLEEFYEINLKTKKMKKWDRIKGILLGFDRNSRQLIIQQKK